jgi:hypothetical protein
MLWFLAPDLIQNHLVALSEFWFKLPIIFSRNVGFSAGMDVTDYVTVIFPFFSLLYLLKNVSILV